MIKKISIKNQTHNTLYFSEPDFSKIEGTEDHEAIIHVYETRQTYTKTSEVERAETIDYTLYHANFYDKVDPNHDGIKWAK